ncbi:MAG: carbon-nitrogen hydrolase family protein [Cyclobacteriaceae bacterium]|jgi:nitrilase|nr:carbon-nitrogen hydrolase family protein [Flammeovirgaceae bacterium]
METPNPFIAAVVQTSPVFFNKAQTVEKIQSLIGEAARQKASLILFPEVIIPGYPRGLIFGTTVGSRSNEGREMFLRYWENSIVVPGPETDLLARSAKEAKAYVVVGVTEKDKVSDTLYCTLLYFSPEGELIHKHRKLKPTAAERILWGEGDGSDLQVLDTPIGKLGGLICWENYMPLARTALYQQGIEMYMAPTADCRATWQTSIEHIACEGRCFVLGCNQLMTGEHYPDDLKVQLLQPPSLITSSGGSCIISPFGKPLSGPLYDQEGILTAEIDQREIIKAKMDFDVIGHYARPDVFDLKVKGINS